MLNAKLVATGQLIVSYPGAPSAGYNPPMVRLIRLALGLVLLGTSGGLARPAAQSNVGWRDPSSHRVRFATVDSSVRLEVQDWGGRGQPVVLLACYLTAHVYDDFAPKLATQFHVYGITRRGLGASDKPASGYTVERSADDVVEVLDSLKIEHRCSSEARAPDRC